MWYEYQLVVSVVFQDLKRRQNSSLSFAQSPVWFTQSASPGWLQEELALTLIISLTRGKELRAVNILSSRFCGKKINKTAAWGVVKAWGLETIIWRGHWEKLWFMCEVTQSPMSGRVYVYVMSQNEVRHGCFSDCKQCMTQSGFLNPMDSEEEHYHSLKLNLKHVLIKYCPGWWTVWLGPSLFSQKTSSESQFSAAQVFPIRVKHTL